MILTCGKRDSVCSVSCKNNGLCAELICLDSAGSSVWQEVINRFRDKVGDNTYTSIVLGQSALSLTERMQQLVEDSRASESGTKSKIGAMVQYQKYVNGIATALAPLSPEIGPLVSGSMALIINVCITPTTICQC
jgi:hypothetical protein